MIKKGLSINATKKTRVIDFTKLRIKVLRLLRVRFFGELIEMFNEVKYTLS